MKKKWECPKCSANTAPDQDNYSFWKCSGCGALRWPWLLWGLSGVLVLILIVVILLWPGSTPEEKFLQAVEKSLNGKGKNEGIITNKEKEGLLRMSHRLRVSEKSKALVLKGKEQYLLKKQEHFKNTPPGDQEITHEEFEQLCGLAKRMEMISAIPECSTSVGKVSDLFVQGEFLQAQTILKNIPDSPEKEQFLLELETPLDIEVKFQYQIGYESQSSPMPLNAPELQGLTLTSRDNYRLLVLVSQDNVYVYIFQKDHYGQMKRLFPDPVWSRVSNPVRSGMMYQVPPGQKEWLYFDELPLSSDSIPETFYIVASPWQAKDIEQLYGKIYEATEQSAREKHINNFMQRLQRRNNPEIKALFYNEFELNHGR
ncbi:MAG: DUF4384 domain-containing protein [Desulfobacterales bacterium]|nr:DUF4384 domain-containing protein [Desulfobacterales bacterium]